MLARLLFRGDLFDLSMGLLSFDEADANLCYVWKFAASCSGRHWRCRVMPDPEVNATTTGFRWPSRGNSFSYSLGGGADVGGNPGFLSISLSHVATLHFCFGCVCVFPIFFSLFSVGTLFWIRFFSNNQHFSVFYITLWNCFTDFRYFSSLLLCRTSVVYMYIIDL